MDAKDIQSASIIPADGLVSINGEAYTGCNIEPVISHERYGIVHAIQWWGDHGHTELSRGPAEPFTDVAKIEEYIPAWLARRAEVLREYAVHVATQMEHAENNLTSHLAAAKDVEKQLAVEDPSHTEGFKARLLRTKDDVAKRIEHFRTLITSLTERHAVATAKADQAEKDAA